MVKKIDTKVEFEKLKTMIESLDIKDAKVKKDVMKQVSYIDSHSGKKVKKPRPESAGPSEFERLRPVDDEMEEFASWQKGSLHSRVEISNAIYEYVKRNELRQVGDKRIIKLDAALKKLLGIEDGGIDEITYAGLQKYIGKHFTESNKK